jgi:hypothetical protein
MVRSLIQLYALTVCFFTLMCFVVAVGFGLYDIVRIAAPDFTLQQYLTYESNEQFLVYFPDKKGLPNEEITRLRDVARQHALVAERKGAAQSLVFAAIIIVIDIVVYVVHWAIAKRADQRWATEPPRHASA